MAGTILSPLNVRALNVSPLKNVRHSYKSYEVDIITISILQRRKLRQRKIK